MPSAYFYTLSRLFRVTKKLAHHRRFIKEVLAWAAVFSLNLRSVNGAGSVVGIATGYGLDGPGIESRWGRDFPHLSRPVVGPTQPPL
jgi:hypothetical protein